MIIIITVTGFQTCIQTMEITSRDSICMQQTLFLNECLISRSKKVFVSLTILEKEVEVPPRDIYTYMY